MTELANLPPHGPAGPRHGHRPALARGDGARPPAWAAGRPRPRPAPGGWRSSTSPTACTWPTGRPRTRGPTSSCPSTLEPLEPVQGRPAGPHRPDPAQGRAHGDGPGDHARSLACFLTGGQPRKTDGADIRVGVSVDQVAAQKVGDQTRLPSLELGIERGGQAGNCDSGYSCVYSSNISWRSATTPMAKEVNPRLVFERLFAGRATAGSAADRRKRERYQQEHPRLRRSRTPSSFASRLGLERPPQARRVPDRASARSSSGSPGPTRSAADLPPASTARPASPRTIASTSA